MTNPDSWSYTFPLTLWWVWKWRNEKVFRNEQNINLDKVAFIRNKVEETKVALRREMLSTISNIQKQEAYISWTPPAYGWLALNTDGAAKGCLGPADAGGILRDYLGRCVEFFSANIGDCTAMRAELMALKKGLSLAINRDAKFVDVRMDNRACIQVLAMEEAHLGPHLQLVKECKELIAKLQWCVTISHCFREPNRAAAWLANKGVFQENNLEVGVTPSLGLARIINEDAYGVAFPRVIAL
ncbi:hypothetical protein RDABS01_029574 [Bienertia sinuspersici]